MLSTIDYIKYLDIHHPYNLLKSYNRSVLFGFNSY